MKEAESEGIRGRLSNAVDHFKKRNVPYARERKFKVPKNCRRDSGNSAA